MDRLVLDSQKRLAYWISPCWAYGWGLLSTGEYQCIMEISSAFIFLGETIKERISLTLGWCFNPYARGLQRLWKAEAARWTNFCFLNGTVPWSKQLEKFDSVDQAVDEIKKTLQYMVGRMS